MPLHVRIPKDIANVFRSLTAKGGLYPAFAGRSAAHVTAELIRDSQQFKDAARNAKAEQHPRPGGTRR